MNEHKYKLEPYKGMNTRFLCPAPNCGKGKTFSRYIDKETGEHIHPSVGRCNRESNCGHHYTPKQYFQDNESLSNGNKIEFRTKYAHTRTREKCSIVTLQQQQPSFIPVEVFKASLKAHETNHFVKFLIDLLGVGVANELVIRYFIGTSKHWNGATVFWQIDKLGKVRTGKIMLYNPITGKRVKEPFNHIQWAHKVLKVPDFELKQCIFGEHLLIDKTKPIAIVESEKTAIIASAYLPQFIWLAVGSITNLNDEKCSKLKGRNVTLFPDLNGFEKWSSKAKELSYLTCFQVSDLLERKASRAERKQGLDLADYLINFNFREFALTDPEATQSPSISQSFDETCKIKASELNLSKVGENRIHGDWNKDIAELETFFTGITLPAKPVNLNPYCTITNVSLFVESHFATVKGNNGNRTFLPYLNRLQELKIKMQIP